MYCREYPLVKLSCTQAMEAFSLKCGSKYGENIYEYSLLVYLVEPYLFAYTKCILFVSLELEWNIPQELLEMKLPPSNFIPKPGWKRVNRTHDIIEPSRTKPIER